MCLILSAWIKLWFRGGLSHSDLVQESLTLILSRLEGLEAKNDKVLLAVCVRHR